MLEYCQESTILLFSLVEKNDEDMRNVYVVIPHLYK